MTGSELDDSEAMLPNKAMLPDKAAPGVCRSRESHATGAADELHASFSVRPGSGGAKRRTQNSPGAQRRGKSDSSVTELTVALPIK